MSKKVEVFTAGTYLCDDIVKRVNSVVCKKCEVIVYDINKQSITPEYEEKALFFGIKSIPAIVVDGKLQSTARLKMSEPGQMIHDEVLDTLPFEKKGI